MQGILSSVEFIPMFREPTPGLPNVEYGFRDLVVVRPMVETCMVQYNDGSTRMFAFPKHMAMVDFYKMVLTVEQSTRGAFAAGQLRISKLEVDV